MATLALAIAGASVGAAAFPAGVSLFGATLTGAAIGSQVGAFAGSFVDRSLFSASGQSRAVQGPRLTELRITGSSEGAPVPRLYGRARLGGQLIWATDFEEEILTARQSSGGGKGGLGSAPKTTTTQYRYYASFAVALAEGEIAGIGRVWADGRELDLATITHRLHTGSDTQAPDSLIEAREGTGNAPAYRGIAYIVFERLALADFGNRIPQLSFEVHRAVDAFNAAVRAVTLIPGAGEFVYAQQPVTRKVGTVTNVSENVHTLQGGTDWTISLDQLQSTLPNVGSVSLIVGWFGTDLRASHCELRPGVDSADKITEPLTWRVAGLDRGDAHLVSQIDGRAAYGGTPSDETVVAAIQDLKDRGLEVVLTPFIFMDVPAGNVLTNPYSGATGQPVYPWRGRITVAPAPDQPGTPDKTSAAALQLAAFVGLADVADFAIDGEAVTYAGPAEWSYRRFILHYAHLAAAAGGVDAFVIGTEMRGLTTVRDGAGTYPFVTALADLAADVKSVLGPSAKVTYAADWSEYFGHQPGDGSGDVFFHLDPLWSSDEIDAIGIDVYWPLADWRDGREHADRLAGATSIYDLDYLTANLTAGEGYDWYYASPADRESQVRTPITDGSAGKPWVFRFKDIRSWWLNPHFDRPGGIESGTPTAWVPQSKPFWFMELGCPAVDKGANQPNVFVDPKSSESHLPYFSSAKRDDFMQRRYLQAFHEGLDPAYENYLADVNPVSGVYGGRMVDLAHMHVYAWDTRPYPAFPADTVAWGDGANWRLGHWLTGRMTDAPLAATVRTILADHGFAAHEAGALNGMLGGLLVDRIMSARDCLQPLELAFFFDTRESGGRIVFAHRGAADTAADLTPDHMVEPREGAALATLTRAQETDLPASAKITYIASGSDYPSAVEEARRLAGASGRVALADLPLVLDEEQAADIAEVWLFEAWAARERAQFALPPSRLALEPGDLVGLTANGRSHLLRITEVGEHGARDIEARSLDADVYANAPGAVRGRSGAVPVKGVELTSGNVGALKAELRSIPQPTVRRIYYERYWLPASCPAMPPALAFFHFDAAVNQGVTGAARLLQEAVGAEIDGEIGPETLGKAAAPPMDETLALYADARRRHYRSLATFWRFGRGWLARVDRTLVAALAIAAAPASPSPGGEGAGVGGTTTPDVSGLPSQSQEKPSMTDTTQVPATPDLTSTKWWGQSMTIWGVIITTLSTVLPAFGPLLGLDITAELVRQLGDQIVVIAQALGGLVGTILTIWGRARASNPLSAAR